MPIKLKEAQVGTVVKVPEVTGLADFTIVQQGPPNSNYVNFNNVTLLMRNNTKTISIYNENNSGINYSNSVVDNYLTGDGDTDYPAQLDPSVIKKLITVKIPYRNGSSGSSVLNGNNGYSCRIFMPSARELSYVNYSVNEGETFSYFRTNSKDVYRIKTNDKGETIPYWTRTPNTNYPPSQYVVDEGGHIYSMTVSLNYPRGIVPTLCADNNLWILEDGTVVFDNSPSAPTYIKVNNVVKGGIAEITIGQSVVQVGEVSSYIYERQVDGGEWTQFVNKNTTIQTDTIGEDWGTVAYRVCGVNEDGEKSAYTTSNTITVNEGYVIIGGPNTVLGEQIAPFTLKA